MAKKKNIQNAKESIWKEGDLIETFHLKPIRKQKTLLMQAWIDSPLPTLDVHEQAIFDSKINRAIEQINGWSEEDLKMKFICYILDLGGLNDEEGIVTYFDKTISAVVEGVPLTVKTDFMLAKGTLDVFHTPYFHFQEYKPNKNPSGDSMAQLLMAFLIAQVANNNQKPLYGIEVIGKQWTFVLLEGKEYCVSETFTATNRDDLLKIIGILRQFRRILREKLMD
ncbi:MAG: hypothetical protein EAZ95_05070 [Bacteroidetes bacterium]|nr:MAG: hypothetical protein EAZ95_05070 [Bacteroidota bacterium]